MIIEVEIETGLKSAMDGVIRPETDIIQPGLLAAILTDHQGGITHVVSTARQVGTTEIHVTAILILHLVDIAGTHVTGLLGHQLDNLIGMGGIALHRLTAVTLDSGLIHVTVKTVTQADKILIELVILIGHAVGLRNDKHRHIDLSSDLLHVKGEVNHRITPVSLVANWDIGLESVRRHQKTKISPLYELRYEGFVL